MVADEKDSETRATDAPEPTKPAQEDVAPPAERVDDEADNGNGKTTKRQE